MKLQPTAGRRDHPHGAEVDVVAGQRDRGDAEPQTSAASAMASVPGHVRGSYPWAVSFGQMGTFALVEMVLFIATVFIAYVYVLRRGGLEWD